MCVCGRVGCLGLCDEALGKRLVNFLNGVDTAPAKVGELTPGSNSKEYLIVTGARYYDEGESITTIMKPLSKVPSIPRVKRFRLRDRENTNINRDARVEKTPTALINNYNKSKNCNDSKERISKALDLLNKIDSNKEMLMPIKVGKPISIEYQYKTASGIIKKDSEECKVSSIKWNLENGEIHCTIFGKSDRQQKTLTAWIEEYGEGLKLRSLSDNTKKCEYHNEIIKMSQFGYIKTVVLHHGEHVAVIDCSNVYYGENILKLKEVGHWVGDTLTGLDNVEDDRLRSIIKQNENYIASHRRWIVPYLLGDAISIKVQDKK